MDDPEVIGDWVRERVLGCGGFGIVTLWKNSTTHHRIAIKKCRTNNDKLSKKHKERWTQEVEMMKRIKNENIVSFEILPKILEQTLNKYNPSKLPMLSMEFCTEGDLRSILNKPENCCGLLESDVRYFLQDIMNAVSYLHSLSITHRDLKPENIVLQVSEQLHRIIYKLIDLGYAKELDARSISASIVGTLNYLAPELLYSKTYSCSVDYWSMGLVTFEVICGVRPFLPNKSPAQWMFHVHKKEDDIIAIQQENESEQSIKYYKEIFHENHVSSCFKRDIEEWLKLALMYDSRKRGYQNNELTIFTNLKKILEKKVLTVFCAYNCKLYSYEIDDCTSLYTVKIWIQRDTKIAVNEQELISTKKIDFDELGLAIQVFDQTYEHVMLFVLRKNDLIKEFSEEYVSKGVKHMLEDASETLPYYFQKQAYAQTLFHISYINKIYNNLLDAYCFKLKRMSYSCEQMRQMCVNMNAKKEKLIAMKDFSKELLDYDYEKYLKNFSQEPNHWTRSFEKIVEEIDKIHDTCNKIIIRHESIFSRTSLLSMNFNKIYSKHNIHDLNKLLDESINCYNSVRSKPKQEKHIHENCLNMAKLLILVLKSQNKLFNDTYFKNCLKSINNINNEIEKIMEPLNLSTELINKYELELKSDHKNRQAKIWELTIKPKKKENIKPNFVIECSNNEVHNYGIPITLEKPIHFILGEEKKNLSSIESVASFRSCVSPTEMIVENNHNELPLYDIPENNSKHKIENLNLENTGNTISNATKPNFLIGMPVSDMINENLNLRHELQEKTNESFLQYKSILNEPLDFDFLYE